MRVMIKENPYKNFFNPKDTIPYDDGVYWPASWISYSLDEEPPYILAFKRKFVMDKADTVRVHVSADERYVLYVDGKMIGRGSERGDKSNWFYETYDIDFSEGEHVVAAKVWALGEFKPWAQVSVYPGFIFSPEGEKYIELMGTGVSGWQVMKLGGCSFLNPQEQCGYGVGAGYRIAVDAAEYPWGFESGDFSGEWKQPVVRDCGNNGTLRKPTKNVHVMRPAVLPPMTEKCADIGIVRYASRIISEDVRFEKVSEENNILSENAELKDLFKKGNVEIKAHRKLRIIADLENYCCVYPKLSVSGGKGACIKLNFAESLFETDDLLNHYDKGNRDEIYGKYYKGIGDIFYPDGAKTRTFDTLWWQAGRYVELIIETADEPVFIESLELFETGYPLKPESVFVSDNENMEKVIPISLRTMQMCMHETYMDCPYYEQLMYGGDTRSEILVTYTITNDSRLPKKALMMFNAARNGYDGLTACAYPESSSKIIPSFSLWWIGMVYDYAVWRGDIDFIKGLMPGVRNVAETILSFRGSDGVIACPDGWNYIDWSQNESESWYHGEAPDGGTGINSIFNWQAVYVFGMLAELENFLGEHELSARMTRIRSELAESVKKVFWDEQKGMFADDPLKENFSEHAQCMALLSGMLDEKCSGRVFDGLINSDFLAKTSVFYSHYLFEALGRMKRADIILDKLNAWYLLEKSGFMTLPELIEQGTRSDCHAWSTHPMYHYYATILGIRPASFGFSSVSFTPQLADMKHAGGRMVHPKGKIEVDYRKTDDKFIAEITLPSGISGVLNYNNAVYEVGEGKNRIEI